MKLTASPAFRRSGIPPWCATRSLEVGAPRSEAAAFAGLKWLAPLQVLDVRGDWIAQRPSVRPGGWAFQYANPYYPDVDDTAVVVMAMDRAQRRLGDRSYQMAMDRARE